VASSMPIQHAKKDLICSLLKLSGDATMWKAIVGNREIHDKSLSVKNMKPSSMKLVLNGLS
jgi:hypothetical protein